MSARVRVFDNVSSVPDHWLFAGVAATGGLCIVLFRVFAGFSAPVVAIFPCTLLLFYAGIINYSPKYRLREDRAGDNLYFIGFIFTVISLGVALYRYQSDPDVNQIIGDLGVGLFSTVLGLVLRIFITNQRVDPDEIEEIARSELSAAVNKTTAGLQHMTYVIENLHASSLQVLEESKDLIEAANTSVIESVQQLDTKLQAINIPADVITSKVDPMLDKLGASIDRLVYKLDSLEVEPDLLAERVGRLLVPLAQITQELAHTIKEVDVSPIIAKLDNSIDGLVHKVDAIAIPADMIADKATAVFTPLDQAVIELRDKLRLLEVSPEFLSDQIAPLIQDVATLQESLREQHQTLAQWSDSINVSEAQLRSLNQTATNTAKALSDTTEQINQSSSHSLAQQEAHRDAYTEVAGEVKKAKKSISELSETVESISKQFAKVMRELTELAEDRSK